MISIVKPDSWIESSGPSPVHVRVHAVRNGQPATTVTAKIYYVKADSDAHVRCLNEDTTLVQEPHPNEEYFSASVSGASCLPGYYQFNRVFACAKYNNPNGNPFEESADKGFGYKCTGSSNEPAPLPPTYFPLHDHRKNVEVTIQIRTPTGCKD